MQLVNVQPRSLHWKMCNGSGCVLPCAARGAHGFVRLSTQVSLESQSRCLRFLFSHSLALYHVRYKISFDLCHKPTGYSGYSIYI